ncbi:Leucine-rich repeat 3 [Arabidopsis suecica]|uniref:Leucine-rich repeat 3 n=1 Tax=Arabidopsis suecica TaxID=45249 RepID=A0A8T1ZVP9_ARASU|nr:Leucine-rich repeat 3 [Arabidopsis suecica]
MKNKGESFKGQEFRRGGARRAASLVGDAAWRLSRLGLRGRRVSTLCLGTTGVRCEVHPGHGLHDQARQEAPERAYFPHPARSLDLVTGKTSNERHTSEVEKPKRKRPEVATEDKEKGGVDTVGEEVTEERGIEPVREVVSGDDCEVFGDEDCDDIGYDDEKDYHSGDDIWDDKKIPDPEDGVARTEPKDPKELLKLGKTFSCPKDFKIAVLKTSKVEEHLAHKFLDVRQGLYVLAEKSLISIDTEWIKMHNLLEQLGKEIARHEPGHQSICDPGKRQLLVDARDICEVLTDDTGSSSVIGIHFDPYELLEELNINEGAFEGMSNLKFLRFKCTYGDQSDKLYLPKGLSLLSPKLRLLQWGCFPMSCLPSNFCTKYLVELNLRFSKLHKLWEGNLPLKNLKWMDLSYSKKLKELPNLSTATKLQELFLIDCTSLVELPSSIGNAISLQTLHLGECKSIVELPSCFGNAINLSWLNLSGCSSLLELPSSIGNATNLEILHMDMCTDLVKLPSSIGNLYKLREFTLKGCLKLEILPTNINLESLDELNLTDCLLLKRFPEISTNIKHLYLNGTAVEEVPSSIKSWSRLDDLHMSYSESLKKFPHALDIITTLYVNDLGMHEIPLWVTKISCLRGLKLNGCKKLVSLPQLPDSLSYLEAVNCESLERLDFSFYNPKIYLNFVNCFKLNKEARELIIQTSTDYAVLPGREVPAKFTYRANIGNSMIVNLNDRPLSTTSRFKACILLVNKGDKENEANGRDLMVSYRIMDKHNLSVVPCRPTYHFIRPPTLAKHLYTFEFEADVTSNEHIFEFKVDNNEMVIKECGVLQP